MKYLKYRGDFLYKDVQLDKSKIRENIQSSEMISEAFENDITWGGSLLGRLINSTIRKGLIFYKTANIDKYIKSLEEELNILVTEAKLSKNKDIKSRVDNLKVRFLITKIHEIVVSKKTVAEKKGELVGDGSESSGLISVTIDEIVKISDESLPRKQELIEKLKRFREALLKLKVEAEPSKEVEEVGEKSKNPQFEFYVQTTNLFKSIIGLSEIISNKRVTTESEVNIGREYLYKNEKGEQKVCMVVDTKQVRYRGPNIGNVGDGVFFTTDDKEGEGLKKGQVYVVFRDEPSKTYKSSSPCVAVLSNQLTPYTKNDSRKDKEGKPLQVPVKKSPELAKKESFFYENESLPIYENVAEVNNSEIQAKSAWLKVTSAYNKSEIYKYLPKIKELMEKSKAGQKLEKDIIISIGKQIMLNKSTVGKPISFDELIKEEAGVIPAEYQNISKSVSILSRIIMAFEGDMGLLGALGESKSSMELFIKSYNEMGSILPKIEPKKVEVQNASKVFNYSNFLSINEADEEIKDENETDTEIKSDEVKSEWDKEFKEGEEKEWKVDEKESTEVKQETDKLDKEKVNEDANDYYDHIIRIVNIFGKAYRLYATEVIPSGRPNGKISQKTFREYQYIGGKDSPSWQADKGPDVGPWAAKKPYQKWQDGVMSLLEKPEYRTVLANVKFVSKPEEETNTKMKHPGSGRNLFAFINDLLAGEGTFSKVRKTVLDNYFTTSEMKSKAENDTKSENFLTSEMPISDDDKGPTDQLTFESTKVLNLNPQTKDFNSLLIKSFTKVRYESGGNKGYMIAYLNNSIKTSDKKNYLLVKFQFGSQSIISSYLSKMIKGKIKLPTDVKEDINSKVYVGVIDLKDGYFANGQTFKIRYIETSKLKGTPVDDDFKTMDLNNLSETKYLSILKNIPKGGQKREIVKITKPDSFPTNDKQSVLEEIRKDENLREKFGIKGKIIK